MVGVKVFVGVVILNGVKVATGVKVGRRVAVSVGAVVRVGVQVGSKPRGVIVAVGGPGTSVFGGKGFNGEYLFCKMLTKKPQAHRLMTTITPVSMFQVRSGLAFFFGREALGFSFRNSS
jgi:hypothetical protein